ncbi:hypothetical protein SprV_0401722900 [Sparganum proliferum]
MRQARDRQRESIALSGSNPGKSVANIFRHRSSSKRGHELSPLLNDNKVFLIDDTDKTEGEKTKEGLCGSQVYEVIKDVYTAWNKGGRVDVYELEAAFTRRLKRSLDALRKRRSQPDSHLDDSDEPSTEPSSSRPREV